jgi:O-antigen/teichoic acid export membrane protein
MYDPRYAQAAFVLQAFMARAALLSLAAPAEDMLIASGEFQVILIGNILRAVWLVAAGLSGYFLFGFMGFVWGTASSGLPPLLYYLWLQRKKGFLILRYELYKIAFACSIAVLAYLASSLLLMFLPVRRVLG